MPVILTGKNVAGLIGVSAAKLSAFRCESGSTAPLLYQIDEVNNGRVVPNDASAQIPRDDTPGVIDEDDQIVFMLRDTGEACNTEQLSRARGTLITVKVETSMLKAPGFVYFLISDRGYVPSQTLVRYNPAEHLVETGAYTMAYDPKHPFQMHRFIMADLKGRANDDVMDRLKVRMIVKALGSIITLHFNEDDLESTLIGTRAGPIRVVRELNVVLRPVPGFAIPVNTALIHYERLYHAEISFTLPKAAALVLSSMSIDVGLDYRDLRGVRISTSGMREGALVDGSMIAQEQSFPLGDDRWFSINGLGVNHVAVLEFEKGLKLTPVAVFADSPEFKEPPEEYPGALPWVGYGLLGWQDLVANHPYAFKIDIAILPGFPDGGAVGAVRAIREGIKTTAQ